MPEKRIATSKVAGTWAWALQRLTAVLLIVLLGIHIWVDHFADIDPEETLTVAGVEARLDQVLYVVVDYCLLAMVLFHGLNGARTVMFDFDIFAKRKKTIDVALWVLGIATLIWGIVVLFPFIGVSGW
ncbi:MAG: hypothetical protein A3K60_08535 [Euryarchaeota archaeon RBG_19FT_COMBO_56_21]|nr:MAG: hypothetical protein A3K60_08535 [Euryarchaeota archaeon RBG_19FT_COMBO_56_21]